MYKNVTDCFVKTVKAEGWRALEKGWLPLYARLGPQTMLTFVFWEATQKWFYRFSSFPSDIVIDY
jgi:hypothetical protein